MKTNIQHNNLFISLKNKINFFEKPRVSLKIENPKMIHGK